MKLLQNWWAQLLYVFDTVTLSPTNDKTSVQQSFQYAQTSYDGPSFQAPNGPDAPHEVFKCEYPTMKEYKNCSTPQNRGCWLRGPNGDEYNITTDYDARMPTGITRNYTLHVANNTLNNTLYPDGYPNLDGKTFNNIYPGPWIQACWGDTLVINVTNHLPYNGTTIHWHGIRQNQTTEMDGVNGVTQCPIAREQSMTYKFTVGQYGTSWYHSHYSLQYADGLVGPMTIYGPSSANYDDAIDPLLVTDWNHRSAFTDFSKLITYKEDLPPNMTSVLLNGIGEYPCNQTEIDSDICRKPKPKHHITFTEGKKYLLRLINTSVDTTFIFSIDNHTMQVVGSDFVPIHPYMKNHVLVGIGQRYHVIVEATKPLTNENYWIRTVPADGCNKFSRPTKEMDFRTGILRYNSTNKESPTTHAQSFGTACADEPYESLVPMVPWTVGKPSNQQQDNTFQVGLAYSMHGNTSRWQMGKRPLWLDFSAPTILNLTDLPKKEKAWDADLVVRVDDYQLKDSWVYLLVTGKGFPFGTDPNTNFVGAAHPIHLHGHDFVILAQSDTPYWDGLVTMKFDNPPRRDVALLPANGYLLLAFKTDNPGTWLMHCHIAWHASSGLALQIIERQKDIVKLPKYIDQRSKLNQSQEVCNGWKEWFSVEDNLFDKNYETFQDDSGI